MHILLVADGRSPTTRRWISTLRALGCRISLVSTYPGSPVDGVEAEWTLPVAFSWLASASGRRAPGGQSAPPRPSRLKGIISAFRPPFMAGRYLLGPLTLRWYGPRFRRLVERIQPDLVHALRIPYEGMLAANTPPGIPLAVTIWGNDLTLHAHGSARMAALTRQTLMRADALLADAARDLRLGRSWGFSPDRPAVVIPGSGGLDMADLDLARQHESEGVYEPAFESLPTGGALVINPRGIRTGSVRADTFFAALPLVLERRAAGDGPLSFACAAMAGQPEAMRWAERLNLPPGVLHLLPHLPQPHLWRLFLRAQITVSVSQHDGTPNSLLEAMALGCFPIAGDIESLREWITPGINGLLVPPDSPQALAEAINLALSSPELRARAAQINAGLVAERAEAGAVRARVAALYAGLVKEETDEVPSPDQIPDPV